MGRRRKTKARGIKSLGDGRYELSVWWTDPKTGRSRRAVRIVEASSVAAAKQRREELRAELRAAGAPRRRMRLSTYAASWLVSKHAEWKPSTAVNAASILEVHIKPHLGDYFLDAIEPSDVIAWRDAQQGAPATVNSRLRLLKQLLGDACHELGLANPAARIAGVRSPLETEEDYIPDAREAAALLAWLRSSKWRRWYPLVELLALTGLRFGEATALRWSDVDFEGGWIHVRRAQWKGRVDHPKTAKARRSVPLLPELAETLSAHQANTKRVGKAYVFLGRTENLLHNSVLTKPMKAAAQACGLADRRMSAAKVWRRVHNNLLRKVADEAVRQALMGHAGAEVGLRHYTRVQQDEMKAAAGAVLRLVRTDPGTKPTG